jgi:WD40 repeat protein
MSEKTPTTLVETSSQRFDVFLSHNSREKPVVERLAEKLKREGIEPWLDKWCLTPTGDWQDELAQGLRASATCAVFVGPSGIGSWEDLEYKLATDRMAKDRAFRVFLVLLPGLPEPFDTSALPPFLSTRTWIDLRKGIEDTRSFQSLINGIKGLPLGPERPIEPRNDICPYRGLQTFDEDHTEFFFGRDADIQRLIEKLKVTRFIAVIGPSGSGKSSLVRAGVIPALKKGVLPESDTWTVRIFTPGAHPLAALAANLLHLYPHEAMNQTLDQLSADERTLHLAVALGLAQRPATERVVWVIDQFEEVFTLCSDEREREQFLANLLYAAFIPNGRCAFLLTLRADFYQKCAAYPELSSRIAEQQFLVSLMGTDNLRQAIEEPAWHVGLEFEQGLVETILGDVENQPGALPLLEHALLELWERRRGRMLTLEAYRESGGVEGAIAKRADTIYTSFSSEQQTIARRIMLRLTQPGEGTEDTRRRATMSELVTRSGESEMVEGVAQAMANARLLTTGTDEQPGEQTVDVSHEALIRGWPRLRKWIEEDRVGLRILRRLTEAAREWQTSKDESLLYRGSRLAQAVEWRVGNETALNELERNFLDASTKQHEAIERRRKRIIIGLAAGLLFAVVLAGLAIVQWRRAREQAQLALSRQLAAQSLALMENQPDLGLLLSVEANHVYKSFEARSILLRNMQQREYLEAFLYGHTERVQEVNFSPDGKLLASASGTNGEDNSVRLWDVASAQPLGEPLKGHKGAVYSVVFSSDGRLLASGDDQGDIILWDVATRQLIGQLTSHLKEVNSLAFSPDSKTLASGGPARGTGKGDIYLWNVATHTLIGEPLTGHASAVYSLAFSPDGKTLASGSRDDKDNFHLENDDTPIMLWDVATQQPIGSPLKGHMGGVYSLAFSPPDGKILASGGYKTIRLWDIAAHKSIDNFDSLSESSPSPYEGTISSLKFKSNGKTLVSADNRNHIVVWDFEFSTENNSLVLSAIDTTQNVIGPFPGSIQSIAVSPETSRWAIGGCLKRGDPATGICSQVEVSIWNITGVPIYHPITENSSRVNCVAFSPGGKTMASGGYSNGPNSIQGEVNIWDTATRQRIGQPISVGDSQVESLAYSPNGKILAAGSCAKFDGDHCKQGEIRLWDLETRHLISTPLVGHSDSVTMLAFSLDGKTLASSDGKNILLSNVETHQMLGELTPGHQYELEKEISRTVSSIAFSPDGKSLASSGCGKKGKTIKYSVGSMEVCSEGEIRFWNVATRQLLGPPLTGHTDEIRSIAFSPDGKTIASASGQRDGKIILWDIATRQPVGQPFAGDEADLHKVIFSPGGETLVSLAQRISLWDVATHQIIGQPIHSPTSWSISGIAFSPNGQMLASTSHFSTSLLLWDLNLESWMTGACRIANRNLKHAEWEHYFPNKPYHRTCPNLPEPVD